MILALPPSSFDPEAARSAAEEILSRPRFAEATESLWNRVLSEVVDFLATLFGRAVQGDAGSVIAIVVLVLAVIAAVMLTVRAVRRRAGVLGGATATPDDVERGAEDWAAEARAHDAAGRSREAVRCWLRVAIARLRDRGVVEEIPGRTVREYGTAVAAGEPALAASFRRAGDVFERVWYGDVEAQAADVAIVRTLAEEARTARSRRGIGA